MQLTRSLEDFRREHLLEVQEFARYLGMTEQTYRRLLKDPERVRMGTRRQVLERLGVNSPYLVAELMPYPSPVLQEQARAALSEANAAGWLAYDPDTFSPTHEVFDGNGQQL